MRLLSLTAILISTALAGSAYAQDANGGAFGGFGSSKEPVQVDAEKLEVLDKEQKAIYSGDVVVKQGKSILRCSKMVVFYEQSQTGAGAKPNAAQTGAASRSGGIRKLECEGPMSAVSGTSTVTGNRATFDGKTEIIEVIGDVILTDCNNVQRGDLLVYNMKTEVATISGGRTTGVFTQGSANGNGTTCQ